MYRVRVMGDTHECPLCGGSMKLRHTQSIVQIPGNPQPTTREGAEWICPDCDYFEDAEENDA